MPRTKNDAVLSGGPDSDFLKKARKQFRRAERHDAIWRDRFVEDLKFANADARNMWQWPETLRNSRGYGTSDERPCLTINRVRQNNIQITNDARQNKTEVHIRAVGDGANVEAGEVFEGIIRHILYNSNAQSALTNAFRFQVEGGIGYVRMVTDYISDDTFDQEIYLRPVRDPLSIYIDPDCREEDGSDANFAFVFEDMIREDFEQAYPGVQVPGSTMGALGNINEGWVGDDKVRVAEYYYRTEIEDEVILFTDPETSEQRIVRRSEMDGMKGALKKAFEEQFKDIRTKKRKTKSFEVKWAKIAGNEVIEEGEWPGSTIPIYYAVGEKIWVDGEFDIKGHTRALIDPQNMLNYNASAAIEYGALQSKTPYLVAIEAMSDLDTFYERANLDNLTYLPFRAFDNEGRQLPPPERQQPPMAAPLYQQGMENAANEIMMASGQYQSQMGEPGNEKSGRAIWARQRQGDKATYHFIDNQAVMIRRIGKDALELIPKIYDTARALNILGIDGKQAQIWLDPEMEEAFQKRAVETADTVEQVIFNPNVGKYDVVSDVGPDYATKRQEAFVAMSEIASQNPALMGIIGDLVLTAMDAPMAEEAAERIRRMIPPQALGIGPDPQVTEMQKQLQAAQALVSTMSLKLEELNGKVVERGAQKDVDIYKAISDRLDILLKYTQVPAREMLLMQHDLSIAEHQSNLNVAEAATKTVLDQANGEDVK